MLLLDTDALSHLLRGTPRGNLVELIAATPPEERCISAVTLGELWYGLARMRGGRELQRKLEREFLSRIEVVPFDEGAARVYGRLRAELERKGQGLGEADLQIAAIARAGGMRLLTGKGRHFGRVEGLEVEGF